MKKIDLNRLKRNQLNLSRRALIESGKLLKMPEMLSAFILKTVIIRWSRLVAPDGHPLIRNPSQGQNQESPLNPKAAEKGPQLVTQAHNVSANMPRWLSRTQAKALCVSASTRTWHYKTARSTRCLITLHPNLHRPLNRLKGSENTQRWP